MAKLPYVDADITEPAAIVEPIRKRRGGALFNLDRILLHSPEYASGWNSLLGTVRNGLELDAEIRELVICMIAIVNNAEYELAHHAPEYLAAGGSQAKLDALIKARGVVPVQAFNPLEVTALEAALELTQTANLSEESYGRVREAFKDPQLQVELIGTIAAYNMVSRVLNAFDIDLEDRR